MEYLFRYERDEISFHSTTARLQKFQVVRETPGGYWIRHYNGKEKWVSKHSVKRYAYPTPEEAWNYFVIRTSRCVKILLSQLQVATQIQLAIKNSSIKITESSYIP